MVGKTISHYKALEIQVLPERFTRDLQRLERFEKGSSGPCIAEPATSSGKSRAEAPAAPRPLVAR